MKDKGPDRMRTVWRTEAAVDSKQTGHWRLGLAIVLPRPGHGGTLRIELPSTPVCVFVQLGSATLA